MPIDLLCLDADDTLWHEMRHFDAAEGAFSEMMAPFADARVARERLDAIVQANLVLYGYGAKSFTLSMIETAVALCGEHLDAKTVGAMLAAGRTLLSHPIEPLPGVEETLRRLARRTRLVLVTKGDLFHQEAKLAASGLGELFHGVEVVSAKTPATYARLFVRHGVSPDRAAMAGDSIRSDVLPVLEAGAWAAYLPPEIAWLHERAAPPADHPRFATLDRFADLPGWLDAIADDGV